jgi:ketosteroid isomerase-like protein
MSRENEQIVRQAFEAFNSEDIERILALTHADFEAVVPPELSAEPDTYRGHDGIRRYFESFQFAMAEIRFQPQRFWEVGQSVVVVATVRARGRQTGIPVEQQLAQVWTIRDGKAIGARTYVSLAEALGAVGLEG